MTAVRRVPGNRHVARPEGDRFGPGTLGPPTGATT